MIKIFTVDAFTNFPFKGNPAAVCIVEKNLSDEFMQQIAFEMNLSETAFVSKSNNAFLLRWFTPVSEVELCGHATLASAHILWQENVISKNDKIFFQTVYKGILTAELSKDGITLDFPANFHEKADEIPELSDALGIKPASLFLTDHHYLAVLNSADDVINLSPDFNKLKKLAKFGIIITSKSDDDNYDFVSRFFAPKKGIDEDPVTGSAHCTLAPYWSKLLNKKTLKAYQASRRGGELILSFKEDRVLITGNAVTVLSGNLNI